VHVEDYVAEAVAGGRLLITSPKKNQEQWETNLSMNGHEQWQVWTTVIHSEDMYVEDHGVPEFLL
jgi:hypothetical protein